MDWTSIGGFAVLVAVAAALYEARYRRRYFTIACPVCGLKLEFEKQNERKVIVASKPSELARSDVRCVYLENNYEEIGGRYVKVGETDKGCGARLTGLYLNHPFVRDCLAKIESLKLREINAHALASAMEEEREALRGSAEGR